MNFFHFHSHHLNPCSFQVSSRFWRSLASSLFGSSTVASEQLFLKHYFCGSNRYSVAQCGVAENYKLLLQPAPPPQAFCSHLGHCDALYTCLPSEIPAQLPPLLCLPGHLRLPGPLHGSNRYTITLTPVGTCVVHYTGFSAPWSQDPCFRQLCIPQAL